MKTIKTGDKVILKATGEKAVVSRIVRAAYKCYYLEFEDGRTSEGYFIQSDIKKI